MIIFANWLQRLIAQRAFGKNRVLNNCVGFKRYLELVVRGSQFQMVYKRIEHVFRRDHITADQQFGFAHRRRARSPGLRCHTRRGIRGGARSSAAESCPSRVCTWLTAANRGEKTGKTKNKQYYRVACGMSPGEYGRRERKKNVR